MNKHFISANNLLDNAFALGQQVIDSGFAPNVIIALWRGGTPIAMAIQELLTFKGFSNQHFVVKTSHYSGINQRQPQVSVEGLDQVLTALDANSRILLVDDIFDSGITLDTLISSIEQAGNWPVRSATPFFKPHNNQTKRQPDYYLQATADWIVFPHELVGLNAEALLAGKPELPALISALPTLLE